MCEDRKTVMESNGDQAGANVEDLGLEVVEDIPQISGACPVRQICHA